MKLSFKIQYVWLNKITRFWLWFAFATLSFGSFIIITTEVQEAAAGQPEFVSHVDKLPNLFLDKIRNPKLNEIAVDLTALGSATVLSFIIFIASTLLLFKQKYMTIIHLVLSGIGAALLSLIMKSYFERTRPYELAHLVNVQGYSYPSGHSQASAAVYFTGAILLCEIFQKSTERFFILGFTICLIFLIASSRVYLGVHYISDVLAGVSLGIGWAALLRAIYSYFDLQCRTINKRENICHF